MKKKFGVMLVAVSMISLLSGCRCYIDMTVNEDKTITQDTQIAYTTDEAADFDSESKSSMTLKTLEDGNKYYVQSSDPTTILPEETLQQNMVLTKDVFYYNLSSEDTNTEDSLDVDVYLQLTVNLLDNIVDTNADISYSENKAVFSSNNDSKIWYAFTEKGKTLYENDKTKPTMKGAKNKKYYKSFPSNIRFSDNVGISTVKLNNKVVTPIYMLEDNKITGTEWVALDGSNPTKNGKNTFIVTDIKGNKSTFTIYVDKKAPVIKGVKNNKTYKKKATIYVKDSYSLAKVTINGKTQKITKKQLVKSGKYKGYYKYTLKKKGTYSIVAKDSAGNKKTVKIKIKK